MRLIVEVTVTCPDCKSPVKVYQPKDHAEYALDGVCPACKAHVFAVPNVGNSPSRLFWERGFRVWVVKDE